MFQSPVLSVEDLFRYGYFIYVTRNGRQGVATISGLRYTQPTHKPIDLSDVDRDVIKLLSTDPATLPVSDISPE